MRAEEITDDIPRMRAALDNERKHQKHRGRWREIHQFVTEELRVFRNGFRIKTIKMREVA